MRESRSYCLSPSYSQFFSMMSLAASPQAGVSLRAGPPHQPRGLRPLQGQSPGASRALRPGHATPLHHRHPTRGSGAGCCPSPSHCPPGVHADPVWTGVLESRILRGMATVSGHLLPLCLQVPTPLPPSLLLQTRGEAVVCGLAVPQVWRTISALFFLLCLVGPYTCTCLLYNRFFMQLCK